MIIGITGHQKLPNASDWTWTRSEMRRVLQQLVRPLVGITSLAIGADQMFAELMLEMNGRIQAIIPFADYERTFTSDDEKDSYHRLLKQTSSVEVLSRARSDEEAFFSAGRRVVDLSELIIAVWDGKPAAGLGGTGDIVNYAIQNHKKLFHLNPIYKTRQVIHK